MEALHTTRSYQQETFERSMQGSTIVVDDSELGSQGHMRVVEMELQLDTWADVASRDMPLAWHQMTVTVTPPVHMRRDGESEIELTLATPEPVCPVAAPLTSHWAKGLTFYVSFGQCVEALEFDDDAIETMTSTTLLVYNSLRSEKNQVQAAQFVTLFAPRLAGEGVKQAGVGQMKEWLKANSQTRCSHSASAAVDWSPPLLIRVPFPFRPVFVLRQWVEREGVEYVDCERLGKIRDFRAVSDAATDALHLLSLPPGPPDRASNPASSPSSSPSQHSDGTPARPDGAPAQETPSRHRLKRFESSRCTIHSLPLPMARIGFFLPNITEHIAQFAITRRLQSEVLGRELIRDANTVLTAISAPASGLRPNYQSFELVGDTALKFIVSTHLFAANKTWHAGLLSAAKFRLVSNVNLARAAERKRLAPYIITERPVRPNTWAPPAISSSKSQFQPPRAFSTKNLADVVEALIGAAWIDSGLDAARECINIFLPDIPSAPFVFSELAAPDAALPTNIADIEALVGYTFANKSLLVEALTHPSCGSQAQTDSYDRLEFLGDAVLDMMVVDRLIPHVESWSEGHLTDVKKRVTRGDFLAFLCLDMRQTIEHTAVQGDATGRSFKTVTEQRAIDLASFVRLRVSEQFNNVCIATEDRFAAHAAAIRSSLQTGHHYPLQELLHFAPSKLFSDIVESVLGAIFVDSGGSFAACAVFLNNLGLLQYLQRHIDGHIEISRPRDRVSARLAPVRVAYEFTPGAQSWECLVKFDRRDVLTYREDGRLFNMDEGILRTALHVEHLLDSGELCIPKSRAP